MDKAELAAILRWLAGMGLKIRSVRQEGGQTIVEIVIEES